MDNINAYNYALGDKVTETNNFINDKVKVHPHYLVSIVQVKRNCKNTET